ncbi:histidine protein methyltransferase 1 homolog [Hemiscyllium ocellatum]|uniref:histidine protein methyltransferase 1 homolog n=1 Tax=Hemiscyllium ocellatum TaxID=170820 RepID=UPI002966E113|nr:histidine protein methyltransferase 1 homolog [Hemiscyllium ocellatum]
MEFKFNFDLGPPEPPGTGEAERFPTQPERGSEAVKEHGVLWEELERILEDAVVEEVAVAAPEPLCLRHLNVWAVERALSLEDRGEAGVSGAIARRSDLVPGVYEGGLKIWQCTFDLIEHLSGVELEGRRVLDLGCGAGLLGIVALRRGAAEVHFQDYNGSVIEGVTLPNVALNEEEEEEEERPAKRRRAQGPEPRPLSRCRFFSGDWSRFGDVHGGSFKYDLVLSSETLYNPDSYGELHDALSSLLSQDGLVYLATKSHYFGVGGGIHLFESFVKQKEVFDIQTVKVIDDGLQRCIATLSFRKAHCC